MTMGMTAALLRAATDLAIADLTLVEDGNFFFDPFTRADTSASLGNSWVLHPNANRRGFNIQDFFVQTTANTPGVAHHTHSLSVHNDDLILQANFRMNVLPVGGGGSNGEIVARVSGSQTANKVGLEWNGDFDRYTIRFQPGNITKTFNQTIDNLDRATLRLVVEDSGSFTFARAYQHFNPVSLSAMDNDLTLIMTHSSSLLGATTESAIGLAEKLGNRLDQFFVCGRNVVVTGLSGFHKIRILGPSTTHSFVEQINGTASIDVDTFAMPMTTLEVADEFSNTLKLITPARGLWGGDEYSASIIPAIP